MKRNIYDVLYVTLLMEVKILVCTDGLRGEEGTERKVVTSPLDPSITAQVPYQTKVREICIPQGCQCNAGNHYPQFCAGIQGLAISRSFWKCQTIRTSSRLRA